MKKSSKRYAVLTCDVIRSRRFDTENFSKVLRAAIDETNRLFFENMHRKFEIMFGDSFQCVLSVPHKFFDVFQHIEEELWLGGAGAFGRKNPVLVRCGVGIGTIDNHDAKLGEMTGEAFILARKALNQTKKVHKMSILRISPIENANDELLQVAIELACAVKSRWTYSHRRILREYRKNQSATQEEIAKKLGISQPYLSRLLDETNINAMEELRGIIERYNYI